MQPNIMFVDDCVYVLECLRRIFKDEPYGFYAFDNPYCGLQAMQNIAFAVVVADQVMPGMMSGMELLKKVRQQSPETVGIIMTAQSKTGPVQEAIAEGYAMGIVAKPWFEADLRQVVSDAVIHYLIRAEKGPANPMDSG